MRYKNLLTSMVFFSLGFSIWSIDLSLADIYQYSPDGNGFTEKNITEDLYKNIRAADKEGLLNLSKIKNQGIPKSILDAAVLSESEESDFILYGFLKAGSNYYDLEIKLYDHVSGEIKTVFYTKTGISNYENLVQTMSIRIITYFNNTLGITKRLAEENIEYGVIDIETGTGYRIPFNPWAESLMCLVSSHLSSSLTPVSSLFEWEIFTFALSYGLGVDYSLGMNKEGFESYYFHSLRMGFPVSLSSLWHSRNKLILQISPELQLDILLQDRLYVNVVNKKSTVFSLTASLGYEYLFPDKRFSLGFASRFHTAFYNNMFFSMEPSLYYRYRFKPVSKGN